LARTASASSFVASSSILLQVMSASALFLYMRAFHQIR
jgi:hypothetical protein